MSTFIQTADRLVNLQNVSSINVVNNRIIFNMNYYIEIEHRGVYKNVSDYAYYDLMSRVHLEDALDVIRNNKYYKDNFITYDTVSVNKNEISSIKISEKKKRIIFNMSHPISYVDYTGAYSITSEFVYFNCKDEDFELQKLKMYQLLKD